MDEAVMKRPGGEGAVHGELKRRAVLWAQAQGYSACALEVSLPRSRYRADVAAVRLLRNEISCTAIFECKQARADLRRDSCCTSITRQRLESTEKRRLIIEKHLRVHYPALRGGDSLFSEWDSHDFAAIGHRNYSRILRQLSALQNQLRDGTKFEKLLHYRCANLFFLIVTEELFCPAETPVGWGTLVAVDEGLTLVRKPSWHEIRREDQLQFLHKIALAGTRQLNRKLGITFEDVLASRSQITL